MTEGISALSRLQIGQEAVAGGTTDPATTVWAGTGMMTDNLTQVFPRQKVGKLGGTTRSYISKTGGSVVLEDDATYEQLVYVFQASIKTGAPTTDASSAKIWTWAVQASDSDPIATTDLTTLVFESGDNIQAEIARFGFVKDFTLSAAGGEALHLLANFETRAPATGTFTSGLSVPTSPKPEAILYSLGSLYIDDSTGTIGTTIKSNTILDMNLKHVTGWMSKTAKDNRLDFSFIKRADDEITLDVTFEHNSVAVAEKAAWRAGTERALRLTFLGTALSSTDAGATYDTKALVIDLYGKWDTFGSAGLEEADGNNVYKGTLKVRWSPAPFRSFIFSYTSCPLRYKRCIGQSTRAFRRRISSTGEYPNLLPCQAPIPMTGLSLYSLVVSFGRRLWFVLRPAFRRVYDVFSGLRDFLA